MEKWLNKIVYLFSPLLILTSCSDEEQALATNDNKDEINLYLHITAPASGLPQTNSTRSWNIADESALEEIDILVFQAVNNVYEYQYSVKAMSISSTGTNAYTFSTRIVANANALKLYLVANSSDAISNLSVGDTESTVKANVIESFPVTGLEDSLPMFGEVELPSGLTTDGEQVSAVLLRSVGRVDVINDASADFAMTSIQFYRANNRIQIIPDAITNNAVTAPSIPSGVSNTVNTDVLYINSTSSVAQLYVPESAVVAQSDRSLEATCVVVGGVYGTDTDTTYYRMDFAPDSSPELFGQILRNHKYVFTISAVQGSGWPTPDEAAINNSSQFDVEIKEWDENTIGMAFDGQNYLGVSKREVNMSCLTGKIDTVYVDTDLSSYTIYWLDDNGNIDENISPISYGESSVDSDSLFNLSVSNDGTTITLTTLTENQTTEIKTKVIRVKAGRFQLTITLNQNRMILGTRNVNFYGSTIEIGTFGGGLLSNISASRPQAMVKMMTNTSNFGPSGTVSFGGFTISGLYESEIDATLAEFFDILYLTYAVNPNTTSVNNIFNWLKGNRVLIIQYDSSSTNANVFSYLGFTPSYPFTLTANTLASNAPTEIVNGPFGTLPSGMTFRCNDLSHGEISLSDAEANNITPILIGGDGGVVLGIDRAKNIVYCGDIDLYYSASNGISSDGSVTSNQDILMANLFAWIATRVLTEN